MATSIEFGRRWWILRACSRNPLVRAIDRLELLVIAVGFAVALVAAAYAGALGTAVYDARSRVYIAQAQTTHAVTGTATEDGTATAANAARWQGRTGWHRDRSVNTGDPLTIWVDGSGDRVDAPAPISQAGVDAVGVAYVAWQSVALAAAGLICWGRSRLDRRRDSAWERDIRCLIDDDGGRTNRKP